MLINTIGMIIGTSIFSLFMVWFSGGTPIHLLDPALIGVFLVSVICLLLITKRMKDVGSFFTINKKNSYTVSQLKNTLLSLDIANKTVVYCSIFISFVAIILLVFNYENLQFVGPNLATVFLSILYALLFLFITNALCAKVEKNMYLQMAEPNQEKEKKQPLSGKKISLALIKLIVLGGFLVLCFVLISKSSLKNDKVLPSPFDIISLVGLLLFILLALIASGTLSDFGKVIGIFWGVNTLQESEQNRYESVIKLVQKELIIAGGIMSVIGLIAILCNLEDSSYLAPNTYLSLLPMLYACVFALVLLPVKAVISYRSK